MVSIQRLSGSKSGVKFYSHFPTISQTLVFQIIRFSRGVIMTHQSSGVAARAVRPFDTDWGVGEGALKLPLEAPPTEDSWCASYKTRSLFYGYFQQALRCSGCEASCSGRCMLFLINRCLLGRSDQANCKELPGCIAT